MFVFNVCDCLQCLSGPSLNIQAFVSLSAAAAPVVAQCGLVVRVCHTLLSWQHFLVSIVRLHQILLFSVSASHQCPASSQMVTSHIAAAVAVLQSWLSGLQIILTDRKQYGTGR